MAGLLSTRQSLPHQWARGFRTLARKFRGMLAWTLSQKSRVTRAFQSRGSALFNQALQSMCSILHLGVGPHPYSRPLGKRCLQDNAFIMSDLRGKSEIGSALYRFGSANAQSYCNEEAATLWNDPINFSTSHRSFLPRKRRPNEFPLIPAQLASLKRVAPSGAAFFCG
jgi:hypothetical protein